MMPAGGASSHPHAIEQAREDFKIYMSKLLEHSAVLDTFRPHTRQSDATEARIGAPAWGPPVGTSGGGGSVGSARASPPAGAALDVPEISFSPSYFREEHAWPRAGATTPPRQRPPPNFSWAAAPPAAPESRRRSFGAADDGDGWKAAWSRRFARGPIHSEYQDRFPWPPPSRSVLSATGGVVGAPVAPPPQEHRGTRLASVFGAGEAGSGGGSSGGYDRFSASPAWSASPLPSRRRQENGGRDRVDGGGGGGGGRSHGARGRSAPPCDRITGVSRAEDRKDERRRRSSSSVDGAREHGEGDHGDDGGRTGAPGGPMGRGDFQPSAAAASSGRLGAARQPVQGEDGDRAERGGSVVVLASSTPSDERVSEWEAVGSPARGSGSKGGGGGGSDRYDRDVCSSVAGVAVVGSAGGAAEGRPEGVEVWRGQAAGRGGVTTMTGGRTLDYSSQSILTEYMDEYAWPYRLPVPGRRGQRTGMGVDHVGRLLSGKRAEEPRRPPDPGVVARLGAAADRAMKAGTPRHLSEMCRLKSPSPACRKLVLGLVVALGLRWRRWSDIRTHLLGNRPELQGFLSRFGKHRAGLTSAALRPFAEDPNLSPTEVRRVATCMVWVSRWLRALHDYLAVEEGKLEADAIPSFKAPTARSGGNATRRHRSSSSHGRAHGTPLGSVRGRSTERASRGRMVEDAKGGGIGNVDHSSRHARRTRRDILETAAARRGSSTGGALSVGHGSAGDLEGGSGGVGGGPAAVSFVGDGGGGDGGDLDDESQWTAGTVTSRGDVLEAPTEDQLDVGSSMVVVAGNNKENARTVRQGYKSAGGGGSEPSASGQAASSSRGGAAPSTAGATRAGTTMAALETGGPKGVRRSARRGLSWGPEASHGCVYRHEQKSRTPSHIANPKARRPTRARSDPILANTRWPPPVEVRARDRTEQRSAFSLEHSFLAYE